MSEVHDQAIHLLAMPQIGIYLTPESVEMVLRALDEVDSLRERAEKAENHLGIANRRLEYFRELAQALLAHEDSPAAPIEDVVVPSATPLPTEPAGDVSPEENESHKSAPSPGQRVAGEDERASPEPAATLGSTEGGATAETPATATETPESDRARDPDVRGGAAGSGINPGEGATASPAAAKWGRADGKGAFHLWREGFSESECAEEVCDGEVLYSDPIPDNTCLSCAAIAGWDVPEKLLQEPDKQQELPTIKRTCAGFNKSADVPCGSPNVSVERSGKWFCKRHDPEKSKACLVPGCDKPGRTAKGSPGIWCKEHGEKLSAEERTDIAERVTRLREAS